MPVIDRAHAPRFTLSHASFVGLAAPSRGAVESCVWEVTLPPGAPAAEHSLDREEVLVLIAGRGLASLDGQAREVGAGDAVVVPAGTRFSLSNPYGEPLVAIAVLPVGGRATLEGGEPFTPPWTV